MGYVFEAFDSSMCAYVYTRYWFLLHGPGYGKPFRDWRVAQNKYKPFTNQSEKQCEKMKYKNKNKHYKESSFMGHRAVK